MAERYGQIEVHVDIRDASGVFLTSARARCPPSVPADVLFHGTLERLGWHFPWLDGEQFLIIGVRPAGQRFILSPRAHLTMLCTILGRAVSYRIDSPEANELPHRPQQLYHGLWHPEQSDSSSGEGEASSS